MYSNHKNLHLAIFDLSSNIHRIYNSAKKEVSVQNPNQYIGEIPIYAVKSVILQILKERNAAAKYRGKFTHTVLVLDDDSKNFRHEIYPEYKKNRPPKDNELIIQIKIIEHLSKKLGLQLLKIKGVESDDVIGTIATKCYANKIKATIFTRDKDLFALIDREYVNIYSGIEKTLYTYDLAVENKGVIPEKISDMLCLVGDVADNIHGISGFGKKTVETLFKDYTLDQLITNPDLIIQSGVRGAKKLLNTFNNSQEQLILMREVSHLKNDVVIRGNLKDWKFTKLETDIDNAIYESVRELIIDGKIET